MKKNLTDEILEELDFTEEEKALFKRIRINTKLCQLQGLESKVKPYIKKMIEEAFEK